jgi:hypothetical protein
MAGGREYRMTVYRAWCEAGPCADCNGSFRYWMMHADHIDHGGKTDGPAAIARNGSVRRLLVELSKCDRVCANCHADRTYRRSKGWL